MTTQELKKHAEAAETSRSTPWDHAHIFDGEEIIGGGKDCQKHVCTTRDYNIARFIAAANPAVIKDLVEELQALREVVEDCYDCYCDGDGACDRCSVLARYPSDRILGGGK